MTTAGWLHEVLVTAVHEELRARGIADAVEVGPLVEPRERAHGDLATPIALELARTVGVAPRVLAEALVARLEPRVAGRVERLEVAGPGFVNIHLSPAALLGDVQAMAADLAAALAVDVGHGARALVEFVSANPTGPLHIGNGWLSIYGDALARLLAHGGFEVSREYYVNDTGGQIRSLGASILAARRGEPIPEEGYRGDYVHELSGRYDGPDDVVAAGSWAVPEILAMIRATLEELNIHFDSWYSQAAIEGGGLVEEVVARLSALDATYEADGALWFAAERFGDTRDRVLRKANGDYTYLAGDIAYHYDKLVVRGFDLAIDVFGADHHGQVASLHAAMRALGIDDRRLEIRLGQMVSLLDNGAAVKFSKRAGTAIALSWLVKELGADATRLLALSSSIDRASQVDLVKARAESSENPVYYIQYAHARVAALRRQAAAMGLALDPAASLTALGHPRELELARVLLRLNRVLETAIVERAPHRVVAWLLEAASAFHGFYHDCPILVEPDPLVRGARFALADLTGQVLARTLALIGVRAVEEM
ncbi:arginyl-tRNA synthetase [Acidimicrobium ferrooxidans DSM 10331]|uniref:Arginine--tRNA ligase n=1 Tax=Acidimicrobium ferrooxidans (strain DSM 10331 / JCM 15462 / NBRC 103882 / ICP) TaxID=525909 RepID=C7M181_ACIFD|nr:arginine--tRNA ligase [Acidimicrobium ferrooxidans]ACU54729.1 arginyl-tRNA synthetase [Acidimicrobium ferrooxidans DSM 10331]